jgi:formylglycine-generating enzyme required for sulfatase activity
VLRCVTLRSTGRGAGPETLRGGAWNNTHRNARVSYRNHNHPDNFNDNIGVRVVVGPDFPSYR